MSSLMASLVLRKHGLIIFLHMHSPLQYQRCTPNRRTGGVAFTLKYKFMPKMLPAMATKATAVVTMLKTCTKASMFASQQSHADLTHH